MKLHVLFASLILAASSSAAVIVQTPGLISVEGIINGSSGTPYSPSDTLDYLTFEVLSPGMVTTTLTLSAASQIWIGRYIGLENEFDYNWNPEGTALQPWTFHQVGNAPPYASLSLTLNPGIYVIVHGSENRPEDDNQVYEIDYGYLPVNPLGGGFTWGDYSYTVAGDIRGLEFRDGELNGTFIVTNLVPEPELSLLLAGGAAMALFRRGRWKGDPP